LTSSSSQIEPSRATSNDHGPNGAPSWPAGGAQKPTSSAPARATIASGARRRPNWWLPSGTSDGLMIVATARTTSVAETPRLLPPQRPVIV
jgi:hypothetical protein